MAITTSCLCGVTHHGHRHTEDWKTQVLSTTTLNQILFFQTPGLAQPQIVPLLTDAYGVQFLWSEWSTTMNQLCFTNLGVSSVSIDSLHIVRGHGRRHGINVVNKSGWLDPTINILYALSSTVRAGVGLVCLSTLEHPITRHPLSQTNKSSLHVSHPQSTASSSPNFQLIINNTLDKYKTRTGNDLLAHLLATQLQSFNSPDAVLTILHQHAQWSDQSQSGDDRWSG